jgi:hypothetical protein
MCNGFGEKNPREKLTTMYTGLVLKIRKPHLWLNLFAQLPETSSYCMNECTVKGNPVQQCRVSGPHSDPYVFGPTESGSVSHKY